MKSYNPGLHTSLPLWLTPHYKEVAGFSERMIELDMAFERIYTRNVSVNRLDHVLAHGTDRDSNSELYNDDNIDFESDQGYEGLAMHLHGIDDIRFTTYLSDPAENGSNRRTLTQATGTHLMDLIYRKDPRIVKIRAEDVNPNCVARSNGFALFKVEPAELLIGIAFNGKFYTPAELREQRGKPQPGTPATEPF